MGVKNHNHFWLCQPRLSPVLELPGQVQPQSWPRASGWRRWSAPLSTST